MPYKHETEKKLIPEDKDRRVKLTKDDKEQIFKRYKEGGISQRALAREYGVSRRLITFIIDPSKKVADLQARAARGGSKIYYDKDKHTAAIKEHRRYKKTLDDEGVLIERDNEDA